MSSCDSHQGRGGVCFFSGRCGTACIDAGFGAHLALAKTREGILACTLGVHCQDSICLSLLVSGALVISSVKCIFRGGSVSFLAIDLNK